VAWVLAALLPWSGMSRLVWLFPNLPARERHIITWRLAHILLLLLIAPSMLLKECFDAAVESGACNSPEAYAAARRVYSPTQCTFWPLQLMRRVLVSCWFNAGAATSLCCQ